MDYNTAVEYTHSLLRFGSRPGLSRITALLEALSNPQKKLSAVHVAGTNGKGSVCACLSAIFEKKGLKTGLFISPFITDFRERMQINSKFISKVDYAAAASRVREAAESLPAELFPTEFEFVTAAAVLWFAEKGCDIVVLETGLGGRLDATNCIEHPALTVITSISLDHMEYLGGTVTQIAGEKAGILKKNMPVVYDDTDAAASAVIRNRAAELSCPAYPISPAVYTDLRREHGGMILMIKEKSQRLFIPFEAEYQAVNACIAYQAARLLAVDGETAAAGIRNAVWHGRMEEIQDGVYLDGAHNEGGIRAFVGASAEVAARRREESGKDGRIFLLFAAVSDKNYESMLETLMRKLKPDRLVLTHLYTSRALSMEAMEKAAHRVADGCEVQSIPDVKTAYQTLVQEKRPEDTCFCVGSLYLIGELEKKISRTGFDSTARMV